MKSVLVLLAPGCEEMEAVISIDVLRRGGLNVVTAGLEDGVFAASRDVKLEADVPLNALEGAKEFDALLLPGGLPGTEALSADLRVGELLRWYASREEAWIAAICAAPVALDTHAVLEGHRFTCYPGAEERIQSGEHVGGALVEDGKLLTSQGPGTAFLFALSLLERLTDAETRRSVAEGLLLPELAA